MPPIRPHSTKIQVKMNVQHKGEKKTDSRLLCELIITVHSDVSGGYISNIVYCFVTMIAKNNLCIYGTNLIVTQQVTETY